MVNITAVLGGKHQPSRAVVQNAGAAYRIPAAALNTEFRRAGVLVQGLVQDISERRATELALQRSNEQLEHFRTLVEDAIDQSRIGLKTRPTIEGLTSQPVP